MQATGLYIWFIYWSYWKVIIYIHEFNVLWGIILLSYSLICDLKKIHFLNAMFKKLHILTCYCLGTWADNAYVGKTKIHK